MLGRYAVLVALLFATQGIYAEDNTWYGPAKPVLVAKGKDYLIHLLPISRESLLARAHDPRGRETDATLLHTVPSTGDMKVLLRMRADRFEVLGYAADHERLYVALRSQFVIRHNDPKLANETEVR